MSVTKLSLPRESLSIEMAQLESILEILLEERSARKRVVFVRAVHDRLQRKVDCPDMGSSVDSRDASEAALDEWRSKMARIAGGLAGG
jgi:hypothetical protein